ncbi:MAG: Hpt domain-containing protein [Actinomycetota bacterium]
MRELQNLELSSGKSGLMQRIIDTFFADVPVKLDALRRGLAQNDMDAVGMAAHTLKGGCPYVGAIRLYELCEAVEAAAAAGDPEGAAQGSDRIESEVPVLRRSIDDQFNPPGPSGPPAWAGQP